MNIYMVSPFLDSWILPNTQMLHVWNIYLQNWVIFRLNVGSNIPAPWSIWDMLGSTIPQLIINQQGNHRFSNDIHGVFRSIGVLPPIQRDRFPQKTETTTSVSSSSIDRRPTCRTLKELSLFGEDPIIKSWIIKSQLAL